MTTLKRLLQNGLGTPILVIIMLSMMIMPLPPLALDTLFTFNIALSLVVLLVVIYAMRPLDFAAFPTVILVATMLRLSLNVASTRVVLLEGHTGSGAAGAVIESFGEFAIGGDYAVGLIIFAILVTINFVVVTKGAGRVSEVSARFTLDAMPGKQMAIDADLNAGVIDQETAKTRREDIGREADFYGSMDGASKFVRGDAIAGIVILFMNIIGGLVIGTTGHGLSMMDALKNYTLLTIGDGLAAQIPSLLLSTATAIIVTRVSGSEDMGEQVNAQLFSNPRVLAVTAGIIGLIGLIPGMPNLAFLTFASGIGIAAWMIHQRNQVVVEPPEAVTEEVAQPKKDISWDDVKTVDVIGLELGYRLISLVDEKQGGQLMQRIKAVRRKLSQELGFLIQPVHIRDNLDLMPTVYRINLLGVPEGEAEIHPDRELAINSGNVFGEISGMATHDPAFGMDAIWIERSQRDHAQTLGYTVVDPATVIVTHLSKLLQDHAHELFGFEEAQKLLDGLNDIAPKMADDLVPKAIPLGSFVKVLQNLLRENVPLKNMRTIVETLAEASVTSQDTEALTAATRIALKRMITQQIAGQINGLGQEIPVFTLEAELEHLLQKLISTGSEAGLGIEPGLTERLHATLVDLVQKQTRVGAPAVLLVSPPLRPWLAKLLVPMIAELKVVAYNEVAENAKVRVIATIGEQVLGQSATPGSAMQASPGHQAGHQSGNGAGHQPGLPA